MSQVHNQDELLRTLILILGTWHTERNKKKTYIISMTIFSRQVVLMPPAPQDHSQVTRIRRTVGKVPRKTWETGRCNLVKGLKRSPTGSVS